jgi:hypothetical protein
MQFDDLCQRTDIFSLNFVASKVYEKYKLFEEKIKNRFSIILYINIIRNFNLELNIIILTLKDCSNNYELSQEY